jgi:hypothetical protein
MVEFFRNAFRGTFLLTLLVLPLYAIHRLLLRNMNYTGVFGNRDYYGWPDGSTRGYAPTLKDFEEYRKTGQCRK